MNRELLIQYIDILNKMENIPYDVNMSRNDLDYSIIQFVEQKASEDEDFSALLSKIKGMPSSDRIEFVNHYFNEREEQESEKSQTDEEEIAKVFGVDVKDIHHLFLANGNEIFSFYSSKYNRNIILENLKQGKSLHEQLEEIQKNNEDYQSDDSVVNAQNIMNEEVGKNQAELAFYTIDELQNHKSEIDLLSKEDKEKLTYLIKHYDELNIVGINISNMIYIDDKGEIHEATLDQNHNIYISQPASVNTSSSNENVDSSGLNSSSDVNQEDKNADTNTELEDMFQEEEDINESKLEQYEKTDKPKVLIKKDSDDDNYGFVNNALYLFVLLLVVIICIILFLVFYKF